MPQFTISRRRLLAAGLAVAAAPAAVRADQGGVVREMIDAINDPAARQPFVERWASEAALKRRPAAQWIDQFERLRAQSGGVDLLREAQDPPTIAAIVRTREQGRVRVVEALPDREAPEKLFRVVATPRPTPYDGPLPAEPLAPAALLKSIERRVAFAAERDDFSGAVRVVSPDGAVFFETAHGLANRDHGVRLTPEARFHLGSADKSFTALLIGRHVADGRLSLEARVADLLPTYANRDAAARITVRHLLNHSSGLGGLWEQPGYDKRKPNRTVTELLPAFSGTSLAFEPGTRSAYSNEGFVVLGAIVEAVGGASWYEQLSRHVYAPADMTRSGHFTPEETVTGRAMGYAFPPDDLLGLGDRRPNWATQGYRGNSCGGGWSTVGDMTSYLRALRAGKLCTPKVYDQFTVQSSGLANYGLGFVVKPAGARTAIGHGGGGPNSGIDGDNWIIKETGWACSILGNYDAPFVQDLSRDIRTMVAAQHG